MGSSLGVLVQYATSGSSRRREGDIDGEDGGGTAKAQREDEVRKGEFGDREEVNQERL